MLDRTYAVEGFGEMKPPQYHYIPAHLGGFAADPPGQNPSRLAPPAPGASKILTISEKLLLCAEWIARLPRNRDGPERRQAGVEEMTTNGRRWSRQT